MRRTAGGIGCWGRLQDSEGVRRGGGVYFPLNCTVTSLSPDAVGVVLTIQELSKIVALDISSDSSEELSTVCRGPLRIDIDNISYVHTIYNIYIYRTYFQVAVHEICLARMLNVLAVVRPLLP